MKKKSSTSQRHFKKRLKQIAKSKARRAELNKKQKQRVHYIAKEVEALRKKREKDFFRAFEQRKLSKKLKILSQNNDTTENDQEIQDNESITTESDHDKNLTSEEQDEDGKMDTNAENLECNRSEPDTEMKTLNEEQCVITVHSRDITSGLVALKANDQMSFQMFKFHGHARVTVLKGICDINGYKMKPGDTQVVYAPVTHPAVVVKLADTFNEDDSLQIHSVDFKKLPEPVEVYQVIISFLSLNSEDRPGRLPGYDRIYSLASLSIVPLRQLCSSCWQCDTTRHFIEHEFYCHAVEAMTSYKPSQKIVANSPNARVFPVSVTVGGKNVGKSTFNRYLVNRLLERYPHVYYLECDVGQTEFTPSGFLSIHKIERNNPLLGPPFTHQLMPKYCCFYGNSTPEGNPTRYMNCVKFLYDSLLRDLQGSLDAPLLVNTMGWIRDVGALLLIDIIRLISPTHILQFVSSKPKHNMCQLTRSYLHHVEGWLSNAAQRLPPYELIMMNMTETYRNEGKYKASDNRILSLLSHIDKIARNCHRQQSLTLKKASLREQVQAVRPYCISMSKVALCNAQDRFCKFKYALALFNASLVALCVATSEEFKNLTGVSGDDVIPEPPVCRCLGMGLVRGVDATAKILYVVSDLLLSEIEEVNCIVRGDMLLPEAFFNNKKMKPIANQPYFSTSFSYDTVGSNSFRSRMRLNPKFASQTNEKVLENVANA